MDSMDTKSRGIRVVSFETDDATYSILRGLVKKHGVRASTFLRAALSDVISDVQNNGLVAIERAKAVGGKAMGRPPKPHDHGAAA